VAGLCERLDGAPPGGWLVVADDAYGHAVSLFALWATRRFAISPPNLQPATLRHAATQAAGVLCNLPERLELGAAIDPLDWESESVPQWDALDGEAEALELFTSGSTGSGKVAKKRIRHLEAEVQRLEATWGADVDRSVMLATASHHHLYGLLFGVLWPLSAGRAFHASHFIHPRELLPRAAAHDHCVLASVPAHLRRLAQHPGLGELRGRCRIVFSSGGPLAAETAHGFAEQLGRAPVEVFGSTETGGVAWRLQAPDSRDAAWTPLVDVEVQRDGRDAVARVRSPFVSVGEDQGWFTMGDRIRLLPDGRFELLGRADRIVKVGEKRLDLAEMESDLRGHPYVSNVALLVLELRGDQRIAAVAVPTTEGERAVSEGGRRGFAKALTAHLAGRWDAVVVPKSWRVVDALPENAQGKVSVESLRSLFRQEHVASGGGIEDRPEFLERVRSDDALEWQCRVPHELACLAGHFPGLPLVPGVLQIDWAMGLAGELVGRGDVEAAEIGLVKFLEVLRPGEIFRIRVELEADGWIRFRLWNTESEFAAGRIRLAAEAPR
jgi:acyl-CoA synthetase (AMP-forming)/AMP-acid ligase II/3-hydroxymyristoyl/3-hydroxydecanoyl-(acyl carrier protein) dehydratase